MQKEEDTKKTRNKMEDVQDMTQSITQAAIGTTKAAVQVMGVT